LIPALSGPRTAPGSRRPGDRAAAAQVRSHLRVFRRAKGGAFVAE
jgi:hypothetical protein